MEWKHINNWFYLGPKSVLIISGLFWAFPAWAKTSVVHERRDSKRNKSVSLIIILKKWWSERNIKEITQLALSGFFSIVVQEYWRAPGVCIECTAGAAMLVAPWCWELCWWKAFPSILCYIPVKFCFLKRQCQTHNYALA